MKLHLGCGKRFLPGFVHVDLADFPHIDHRHDIRTLPMFADGAATLIYACHVLEYFDRIEVRAILAEWRRVLEPAGVLRVAVPDLEALAAVYAETGDLGLIHGPLYGRWEVPESDGVVVYHRTVYDFASLRRVLESAGFEDPVIYDWRRTEHRAYDDFSQAYVPHMDKDHGRLVSLNVEARKPHARAET